MRVGLGLILLAFIINYSSATDRHELDEKPRIAIIIDDLGDRLADGRKVISLPGRLTIGIIPYTPYARKLAQFATEQDKELILHLPMESIDQRPLGKAGLHMGMSEAQLRGSLSASLKSIKNIRGISNHMGSRLTQDAKIMQWLMAGIHAYGDLYFVDSRTIDTSQAQSMAEQAGIDHVRRDVFLDNDKSSQAMTKQWTYFLRRAKKEGSAGMIAHPYPQTIAFLKQRLNAITGAYELLTISELIRWRNNRSKLAWQRRASSFH